MLRLPQVFERFLTESGEPVHGHHQRQRQQHAHVRKVAGSGGSWLVRTRLCIEDSQRRALHAPGQFPCLSLEI